MAAWSGFTDEDLRKMRSTSHEGDDEDRRHAPSKRGMSSRRPRGSAAPRHKPDRPTGGVQAQSAQSASIGSDQKLSESTGGGDRKIKKECMLSGGVRDKAKTDAVKVKQEVEDTSTSPQVQQQQPLAASVVIQEMVAAQSEVVELSTDQALSLERDNVVKFQQQQKVIEEANKQKRALLSKAIEERRKMAKAEAQKLVKIQQELNHLDTLLNLDVGIIRDKIETASLDYAQAQKRYERAEKEFIEAKMDLYEKSEAKERLTEHLYTIINQNEVRKAKKLVELMEQLAMQISPEEMELSVPSIPHLTNFTAASTIHHPSSNKDPTTTTTTTAPHSSEEGDNSSTNDGAAAVAAEDGNCSVATAGKKTTTDGASVNNVSSISGSGGAIISDDVVIDSGGTKKEEEGELVVRSCRKNESSEDVQIQNKDDGCTDKSTLNFSVPSRHNDSGAVSSNTRQQSSEIVANNNNPDSSQGSSDSVINPPVSLHPSSPHPANKTTTAAENASYTTDSSHSQVPVSQQPSTVKLASSPDTNGNSLLPEADVTTKAKGWSLPFM